jgi:imidazolonepropionase-like amidohydrolase
VAAGKLADVTVWDKDPIADIAILQDAKNLSWVVKDGRVIDLYPRDEMLTFQQAAE